MVAHGPYRYLLTRRWGRGAPALFVMLNPSTADDAVDDPTIRALHRVRSQVGRARDRGRQPYALRATRPRDLFAHAAPVGPDNDAAIVTAAARAATVVVAWGVHGARDAARVRRVIDLLDGRALACLGTSLGGQPRHPLYLPSRARRRAWRGSITSLRDGAASASARCDARGGGGLWLEGSGVLGGCACGVGGGGVGSCDGSGFGGGAGGGAGVCCGGGAWGSGLVGGAVGCGSCGAGSRGCGGSCGGGAFGSGFCGGSPGCRGGSGGCAGCGCGAGLGGSTLLGSGLGCSTLRGSGLGCGAGWALGSGCAGRVAARAWAAAAGWALGSGLGCWRSGGVARGSG